MTTGSQQICRLFFINFFVLFWTQSTIRHANAVFGVQISLWRSVFGRFDGPTLPFCESCAHQIRGKCVRDPAKPCGWISMRPLVHLPPVCRLIRRIFERAKFEWAHVNAKICWTTHNRRQIMTHTKWYAIHMQRMHSRKKFRIYSLNTAFQSARHNGRRRPMCDLLIYTHRQAQDWIENGATIVAFISLRTVLSLQRTHYK